MRENEGEKFTKTEDKGKNSQRQRTKEKTPRQADKKEKIKR